MKKIVLPGLVFILSLTSCKKEETVKKSVSEQPGITLPTTYNFSNVSYSGQTARLDMLELMTIELKKANSGNTVNGSALLNMFSNTGNPFNDMALDTSGKQLKNKCYNSVGAKDFAFFEGLITEQANLSAQAGNVWSAGNPGVASSGTKKYFLDSNGVEYTQLIEKGLMGAVFYYNIAEVYTRTGKIGDAVDNNTVTPGKGTSMEHHWDEAFGYWGAPIDFTSSNTAGSRYHAKYALKGDAAGLNTINKVMGQFIKGRYGISNKNYTMRDEAASQLRKEYEQTLVTTGIHYLNGAKSDFADDALRNHQISEAYAFIFSLAYNSDKLISTSDLNIVLGNFEQNNTPNFLTITLVDINAVINKLSTVYGLDSVKDNL
jgi:hypothetical protein